MSAGGKTNKHMKKVYKERAKFHVYRIYSTEPIHFYFYFIFYFILFFFLGGGSKFQRSWPVFTITSTPNRLDMTIPVSPFLYKFTWSFFIGGASFWVLGHDLQGAIQYVIKRRRLSLLSLKIEVTIMLKFQGRQIKIRLIGRASPSAQHAKEWKHCLLVVFNVQWINCLVWSQPI